MGFAHAPPNWLGHSKRERLHVDAVLPAIQSRLDEGKDFLHGRIRHGKAPDRMAAAMHHDRRAGPAKGAIERIGEINVERPRVPALETKLAVVDPIKAFGSLTIPLTVLWSELSRPEAYGIG